MTRFGPGGWARWPLAWAVAGAALAAVPAHADDATPAPSSPQASSQPAAPLADADLGITTGPNPSTGLPIGGFLVYPSVFAGIVYNDNLYATQNPRDVAVGVIFSPHVTAVDDQGLHKTTLTFNAEADLYPSYTQSSAAGPSPTNVSGVASLEHVWTPTPDVTIDAIAGFTRQYGMFGSMLAAGPSWVSAPSLGTSTGFRQFSDQITAALSVEKKINSLWFVRGGVGAADIQYEAAPTGLSSALGGMDYNGFLRTGYWVTPQFNAFVEGGADLHRYGDSWYDSNSYRIIGGLSSDLISLFKGEIYAGYQTLDSVSGTFGAVSAPAYGAKISYYPTRYLTISGSLDETFGSAATPTTPTLASPSGETVEGRLAVDYAFSEYWNATARAGYAHTTWSDSPLVEDAWTVGGSVNYNFWRNIALSLNYQYTASSANLVAAGYNYTQNLASVGLTYHY